MSEQPESLRLADELEKDRWHISGVTAQRSADELRRLHEEVERLRGVLKADSEQQAAHIRGLNESWEAEREILAAEIEQLTSERDAFMEMAERLTADLEALRARVFVRR